MQIDSATQILGDSSTDVDMVLILTKQEMGKVDGSNNNLEILRYESVFFFFFLLR